MMVREDVRSLRLENRCGRMKGYAMGIASGGNRVFKTARFRTVLSFAVCVLLSISATVVGADTAFAGTCSGVRTNYFDGWFNLNTKIPDVSTEGVHGKLTARQGNPCTGEFNQFTTAWVMIASRAGGGGYSQAGFMYTPGSGCNNPFAEYNRDGLNFVRTLHTQYCYADGQHLVPEVRLIPNGSGCSYAYCERNIIDGVVMSVTPFSPFAEWSLPFSDQFSGETLYKASNMPGLTGSLANFDQLMVQRISDDQFQATMPLLQSYNDYPTHYGLNGVNGCSGYACFDIWTAP